jgi:hypothetical protein
MDRRRSIYHILSLSILFIPSLAYNRSYDRIGTCDKHAYAGALMTVLDIRKSPPQHFGPRN